jgi:hypothetical protein
MRLHRSLSASPMPSSGTDPWREVLAVIQVFWGCVYPLKTFHVEKGKRWDSQFEPIWLLMFKMIRETSHARPAN